MTTRSRVLLLAALAFAACGDGDPTDTERDEVASVDLTPGSATLLIGDTLRLEAEAFDEAGGVVTVSDVDWDVSAPERIALIDAGTTARITALDVGEVEVTATIDGHSATTEISIEHPAPTMGGLAPSAVTAGSADFTLVVTGDGFSDASTVQWNGANRPTTFVDAMTLHAAIAASDVAAAGSAQVRVVTPAPGGGTSAALAFTIEEEIPPPPGPVATVELDVDSVDLEEGDTLQLHATVRDSAGTVITGLGMTWSTSDAAIALVNGGGRISAIRDGRSLVTVTVHGKQASAVVHVHANYAYDLVYTAWDPATAPTTAVRVRHDLSTDDTTTIVVTGVAAGAFVFSPAGDRLAFFGTVGAESGLFVANGDGTNPVRISDVPATDCGMHAWRPDGARIAYVCGFTTADQYVGVVDADASASAEVLTSSEAGRDAWPSWSPLIAGGYRIAYARTVSGEPRIFTMKEDGTDHVQITTGMDDQPSWSPDGSTIVFQRSGAATFGDLWLVDAAGGNERGLTLASLAGPQERPNWSPDGRLIAFVSRHETYGTENSVPQIYTIAADGSRVARRSDGPLSKYDPSWVPR
ncbi:MAG TPA: hypothetical protein VF039_13530 [Longimicrobiales bacterium]